MASKKKPEQIVVSLERRKKKHNVPAAHREALRKRMQQPEFRNNTRPGEQNGNPKGYNQYTHPRGHKNISEAMKVYVNDRIPDRFAHLVRQVGLDPEKTTFADAIAMRQLLLALEGSLSSAQFVQDNAEDKMKGPGASAAPAPLPLMSIKVVRPKD